jgi:hypothetical protein
MTPWINLLLEQEPETSTLIDLMHVGFVNRGDSLTSLNLILSHVTAYLFKDVTFCGLSGLCGQTQ